jgi:hypothetical protein
MVYQWPKPKRICIDGSRLWKTSSRLLWKTKNERFAITGQRVRRSSKRRYLPLYIFRSRILVLITAPVIYVGLFPFLFLDLFLVMYQGVCFPLYGIPKVKREDYFIFDRAHLKYLNLAERLNCAYCSYANGLCGYVTEIAARTEQHWCPIKHARRLRSPHSRYSRFFDYGDARLYQRQVEKVRNDFVDLRSLTSKQPRKQGSKDK